MIATIVEILAGVVLWVGHACIWTTLLNIFYSQPLPKTFLKLWRLLTGAVIGLFPILLSVQLPDDLAAIPLPLVAYFIVCLLYGAVIFPIITAYRNFRPRPACISDERTETLDLWKTLGPPARGDGKWQWVTRLPGNGVFNLDVTELSLELSKLPAALDGVSILLLSDLHFHGTPSRLWFDAVIERLLRLPKPDIVVLAGDFVDSDAHHDWIASILGRLQWNDIGVAILGNHDTHHRPGQTRDELVKLGFAVLGDGSKEVAIRGERVVFTGNEAPWFPAPASVPAGGFRICVSHSPDQFRWAQRHAFDLILCGHVHGGQIRLPIIGSIFIPSLYGRRYDMGVFETNGTAMVVGRGLSGKEPLRFRCNPQVIRIVLRCENPTT